MQHPYILTEGTFTLFVDGVPYATDRTNPGWEEIKREINKVVADTQRLIALVKPVTTIAEKVSEIQEVTVRGDAVYYGDERIHDNLAKRMLDIMQEGISLDPWVKFAQNIYANPAKLARQELYDFLEASDLPITSDGHFLAYKIVGAGYKDIYSGKFDNSVGQVVELPGGRRSVDDNRERTCSYGLHFCSKGYLNSYGTGPGNHVMIVKINPADVVSIPTDYNFAKGRTYKYEVVAEMDRGTAEQYLWRAVESSYDNLFDDEEWDSYGDDDLDDYYSTSRRGSIV